MSKALVALVNPGVPKEVQHLNQVKPRWKRVGMKAFRQHLRHGCGSLSSCQEIVFTHILDFFLFFYNKKKLAKYRYCDEEKKPPYFLTALLIRPRTKLVAVAHTLVLSRPSALYSTKLVAVAHTLVLWSNRCAFTWDRFSGIVLTMYHKCSLLRSNGNHRPSHQEVQGFVMQCRTFCTNNE
jgi:hypothetical protein